MSNSIEIGESEKKSNKSSKALGDQPVTIKPLTHFRDVSIDLSERADRKIDELLSSISRNQSSEAIAYHSTVEFEDIEDRIDQTQLNSTDIGSLVPTEFMYSNGEKDYNVELQDFTGEELIYELNPFHPAEHMVEGQPQEYSGQEIEEGSVEISMPINEAENYAVAPEEEIADVFESYRREQQ